MPDDSFFANRPKKQQSLAGVPSGSQPRSPVSCSFSNVSLQIIIRSPHPRLGKFVFSDPKRVLQHYLPDIAKLFDHLVGARKERWRYGEAKRLCGLKINRQLEPSWLNDRQFGRLLTF
jgi:hypothetical protein